jgi:nitronate monooxygenase
MSDRASVIEGLELPIVLAPMAGGPSTPALAVAVSEAGGLGFLAAGYKTAAALSEDIEAVRASSRRPFGVNVFARPRQPGAEEEVRLYARSLEAEAARYGVRLGEPRFDDDEYEAKLALLRDSPVAVASFTFGCPSRVEVESLQAVGTRVWVTVTNADEAALAERAGADALVAQGIEAGGHRAYFDDRERHEDQPLLSLLRVLARDCSLPLVATGGIMDGPAIAAVLCAGAAAAQLGTALMLTPEAGTTAPHREAIESSAATALTRAFSGRLARGIVNRFMLEHDASAPHAYPEIHHVTTPIRSAARAAGDADGFNLWAGQAHALATRAPAGRLVAQLAAEAREALERAKGA